MTTFSKFCKQTAGRLRDHWPAKDLNKDKHSQSPRVWPAGHLTGRNYWIVWPSITSIDTNMTTQQSILSHISLPVCVQSFLPPFLHISLATLINVQNRFYFSFKVTSKSFNPSSSFPHELGRLFFSSSPPLSPLMYARTLQKDTSFIWLATITCNDTS